MNHDDLLTSEVCTALMRIGTRMAMVFDRTFRELDLTQAQFRLLIAMYDVNDVGIAPSDLAEALLIERATVTVLTARLVDRGLVVRMPGVNRRTHFLKLTEEGVALLERAIPSAVRLADAALMGIERGDLEQARMRLETIEARLRLMSDAPID
ncbi:MAG: MarR family transcriptional regulator [Capsulimonas sp.]|uniref:MarR family winged helix-turn-helix transcriptional regulator n=1 Tax=Capsulimonas sp. TaxID=2494211 RepID=UPI003267EDC3